jgi:hypothetical protein
MNNFQCYCYSVKAIANLLKSDVKITPDTLYGELYYLWDIYTEEAIEKLVRKEEFNNELF